MDLAVRQSGPAAWRRPSDLQWKLCAGSRCLVHRALLLFCGTGFGANRERCRWASGVCHLTAWRLCRSGCGKKQGRRFASGLQQAIGSRLVVSVLRHVGPAATARASSLGKAGTGGTGLGQSAMVSICPCRQLHDHACSSAWTSSTQHVAHMGPCSHWRLCVEAMQTSPQQFALLTVQIEVLPVVARSAGFSKDSICQASGSSQGLVESA